MSDTHNPPPDPPLMQAARESVERGDVAELEKARAEIEVMAKPYTVDTRVIQHPDGHGRCTILGFPLELLVKTQDAANICELLNISHHNALHIAPARNAALAAKIAADLFTDNCGNHANRYVKAEQWNEQQLADRITMHLNGALQKGPQ